MTRPETGSMHGNRGDEVVEEDGDEGEEAPGEKFWDEAHDEFVEWFLAKAGNRGEAESDEDTSVGVDVGRATMGRVLKEEGKKKIRHDDAEIRVVIVVDCPLQRQSSVVL